MGESTESKFLTKMRKLRAVLADETNCMYFVYTPIGIIRAETWTYVSPGMVAMTGEDESRKYRLLVFSDEAMSSFFIEVKRKQTDGSKEVLGFKPSLQNKLERA